MTSYICSHCGAGAYYDGVLICKCDKSGAWIDDGHGGYFSNVFNAHPILGVPTSSIAPKEKIIANEEKVYKENMIDFNVGDVVQLKSGGPLMTVEFIYKNTKTDEDGKIFCIWLLSEEVHGYLFVPEALVKKV